MPKPRRFIKYVPKERPKNYAPKFSEYERLKIEWINSHPEADHAQYCEAIRAIAARCGI